jgi:hypothetical protein
MEAWPINLRDTQERMATQKIVYPKALKDIPSWRMCELAEDLAWFSKFSPSERLRYVDREWAEIQSFIEKSGIRKHGTKKRS